MFYQYLVIIPHMTDHRTKCPKTEAQPPDGSHSHPDLSSRLWADSLSLGSPINPSNPPVDEGSILDRGWVTLSRECSVIPGITDGLNESLKATKEDLCKGAQRFVDNPWQTTKSFFSNHLEDFTAGALISFINPKGWKANLLIGIWSLRGLGSSLWQAGVQAANPDSDLGLVRRDLSSEVSHEGTAFLTSLPLTMAGGIVGRASADAIFGHNLAAWDMALGQVGTKQIHQNLWNIHDTFKPPEIKAVILDVDDSLVSFSPFCATAVDQAVSDLSPKINISTSDLKQLIGTQTEKARCYEYPWALELALRQRLKFSPEEFQREIAEPYWNTYDAHLKSHCKVFPDVQRTLPQLKARGLTLVSLSAAPAFDALKRITLPGLDTGEIEALYALEMPEPGELSELELAHGRKLVEDGLSTPHNLKRLVILPKSLGKPNPGGHQMILDDLGLRPKQVLAVGDSRINDMGPAHRLGIPGIWYRGGLPVPEVAAKLRQLSATPPDPTAPLTVVKRTYAPRLADIDSFEQILDYLEPRANYLKIAADTGRALWVLPRLTSSLGYNLFPYQIPGRSRDVR